MYSIAYVHYKRSSGFVRVDRLALLFRLLNQIRFKLGNGRSFQEVEGLEEYYSTELVCDGALHKLYPSQGWISYSAPGLSDQTVELNRCGN